MTTSPEGEVKTISNNSDVYQVKSTVHVVWGIVGRSTRVWSALDGNKKSCIIKDGWIQEGRADAERQHLEKLRGIQGIPTLLWGGTVQIHDPKDPLRQRLCDDNTAWICHGFSDERRYRLHHRLILYSVGQDLSSFTSLGELVTALRDYSTIAHEDCCKRGVIHRDVSFNNILLVHNDNQPDGSRQGMLIDFDYAASTLQKSKIGQHTVRSPSVCRCMH
ncbi:hypothetical protein BYT27DRAFT_7123095 [Phlegmacium glaucopus]|nr:hypothetical protein BYT27DRAFT_7123095 [Phlegmacium glaucopus]